MSVLYPYKFMLLCRSLARTVMSVMVQTRIKNTFVLRVPSVIKPATYVLVVFPCFFLVTLAPICEPSLTRVSASGPVKK